VNNISYHSYIRFFWVNYYYTQTYPLLILVYCTNSTPWLYFRTFLNSDWPHILIQGKTVCLNTPCKISAWSNSWIGRYILYCKIIPLDISCENPNFAYYIMYLNYLGSYTNSLDISNHNHHKIFLSYLPLLVSVARLYAGIILKFNASHIKGHSLIYSTFPYILHIISPNLKIFSKLLFLPS
jgi:hypothetical protein